MNASSENRFEVAAIQEGSEFRRSPGPVDGAATSPPGGRRIKPLVSLKAHKFVALGVFVLIVLAGIPAAIVLGRHLFYTEAVVHVSPRFVKNLTADQELELQSNTQYREYVQQQVKTINRYDIVLEGLTRLGNERFLWQRADETDRSAAERLGGALMVKPVPDTYLITVGLEDKEKEGLAEIINSVVAVYVEKQKKEEFYASDERVKKLKEERQGPESEMAAKTAQRNAISEEIGATTFSSSFLNPYDQLLIKTKGALDDARRQRIQAEAELAALYDSKRPESEVAANAFAQELIDKEPGLTSLKENLNGRRSQLLTKLSGLGPQHPGRVAINRELAQVDEELKKASDAARESYRLMLIERKQALVYTATRIERDLTVEAETQGARTQWFAERYQEALTLGLDIDRARKRLNDIDDRIEYLTLESNAPGFVRIVSTAREPLSPFKSGRKKTLAMFFGLAVLAGLILPIGIDFLDPRVNDTNELWKVLGFAPLGYLLPHEVGLSQELASDQLLRLAASIDRERRQNGTVTFLFASSKAGEGTTTTVLALANTLNQIGTRAIAVEVNALKPDERYLGPVERPGIAAVIDGRALLEAAIQPATDELPDRIAMGNLAGRRHLGRVDRLKDVLADLTRMYEIVLLDSAPLLLSAEAEVLAGAAGATLLIVQAGGISKGEIKRAVRTLERLSPPAVGAILTGLKIYKGGGYMGDLVKEHWLATRLPAKSLTSPWLWR